MGEDTGTSGTPALTIAEGDPERIRQQIDVTRVELGDTVAALACKADVKRQAKAHPRPLIAVGAIASALVLWRVLKH